MKDLKNKLFLIIFIIFTFFNTTITSINLYQNYKKEYENVKESLSSVFKLGDKKVFLDQKVYTIFFNSDKEISTIVSYSIDEDDNIENIANKILQNNKYGISIHLLFNKYSYSYDSNKLVIVNNTNAQTRLFSTFNVSLSLYIIFEVLGFIISKKISEYVTKPVIDSFEKQKNFIADASHELKTPIAVIMASSDALTDYVTDTKYLDNIKNETERMSSLVTDLLDLSKIENNKKEYIKENISKIINKRVLTFEALAYENKVSINTNIEDDIYLVCDKEEINKLVGILLDNAIKHSFKNKKIDVELTKNNNDINLSVTNKGEEISKEDINKIFERFYKIDKSRNRNDNHYGLGLAIAKSIVNNYNGKISVVSENKKTTFKVVLKNK